MRNYSRKMMGYLFAGLVAALFFPGVRGECMEISMPAVNVKSGQEIRVPVKIDAVENLAGVKLVLKYDAKILKFLKVEKTRETASLLHVVNDRKPGTLIVVMAGARGIRGKNLDILNLFFSPQTDGKKSVKTNFEITEVQLMSDKLVELKAAVNVKPIEIEPFGSPPEKNRDSADLEQKYQPEPPPVSKEKE